MEKKIETENITNEMLFIQLVSMFQAAAMQHLGKIMNPLTNKIERDLDQAKISIDMIGMIKNKTQGNLGEAEEALLDKVLFELRMNYVEEIDRLKKKMEKIEEQEKKGEGKGTDEKASSSEQLDAMQTDKRPKTGKAASKAPGRVKKHSRGGSRKKKGIKKKAKGGGK